MQKAHEISEQVLFEEKQRFPKWLTFLLVGVLLLVLVGMILLAISSEEEKSEVLLGLAVAIPIELVIIYLFLTSELELAVTSNGLYYRWKPLHEKFRVIEKEMIETVEIRRTPMFNTVSDGCQASEHFIIRTMGQACNFICGRRGNFFSTKGPGD